MYLDSTYIGLKLRLNLSNPIGAFPFYSNDSLGRLTTTFIFLVRSTLLILENMLSAKTNKCLVVMI